MRRLPVIFLIASASLITLAGTGSTIKKAYVDHSGKVQIATTDGREQTIRPRKWQSGAGFEEIKVAPDGRTVGWLADRMLSPLEGATNYPYTVATELEIWRDGRVIRRFGASELVIQNWIFLKDGEQVAFHIAPPHGQEFYDCTLIEVNTGKKLAHWALDRRDYVVPDWAKPLLEDDPLPGPDEISNWFPESPAPAKNTLQPKQ
jgi:hypothetical protein